MFTSYINCIKLFSEYFKSSFWMHWEHPIQQEIMRRAASNWREWLGLKFVARRRHVADRCRIEDINIKNSKKKKKTRKCSLGALAASMVLFSIHSSANHNNNNNSGSARRRRTNSSQLNGNHQVSAGGNDSYTVIWWLSKYFNIFC